MPTKYPKCSVDPTWWYIFTQLVHKREKVEKIVFFKLDFLGFKIYAVLN